MLFLLRLAFWAGLICLLLPGSGDDNRRLMRSAEKTVADMRGFCQRNPDVCDEARVTMTSMLIKLKNGAELVQSWLAEDGNKPAEGGAASPAAPGNAQPATRSGEPLRIVPKWQDSLDPADKRVPWRGPSL